MALLCSDLFDIQLLKDLRQVAGTGGNSRTIQWAYKLESTQLRKSMFYGIQPGDLIVIFGTEFNANTEDMVGVIEEACKRGAAGIIMCFGRHLENITYEVTELSDRLKFPVYELYIEAGMETKIVKEICKAIVVDDLNKTSEYSVLESILNNENVDGELVAKKLKASGMNIGSMNQIGVIALDSFSDYVKDMYFKDQKKLENIMTELNNVIKSVFVKHSKNIMTVVKKDMVVFLTPAFEEKNGVEELLFKIDKDSKDKAPGINFNFGLGGAYPGIQGIYKSFRESKQMLMLRQVEGFQGLTTSLRHMDVYLLLMGLKDRKILEKYLSKVLDPLMTYDKLNQVELIDTLDAYLNENASTIEASDKLFIHKNTLKYRLKKIETLLNVDLHSLEDCLRLLLAVKVYKLFKLSADRQGEEFV